jgi:DNA end-binding protein Ku
MLSTRAKEHLMAARSSWEGYLRLNLLSVPVKAYNTMVSGGGRIRFHLVHAECQSRIHYKKVCPIHGEVPNEEIVSGYEYAKGKYVIVEPHELDKLLPENDRTIDIDVFVRPDELDPVYYGDKSYYLVPDGRVAERPYAVLQRVMEEKDRYAIARVIFSGVEHVVVVRPVEGLLAITMLNYQDQTKGPSTFKDEVPDARVDKKELELAESLVDASTTDEFDFGKYHDEYTEKLASMLEAKASGKRVAPSRRHEEPVVINLMDALRKSLDRAKSSTSAKHDAGTKRKGKKSSGNARTSRRVVRSRKTG